MKLRKVATLIAAPKDGSDGRDAATAVLDMSVIMVPCRNDGTLLDTSAYRVNVTARLFIGGVQCDGLKNCTVDADGDTDSCVYVASTGSDSALLCVEYDSDTAQDFEEYVLGRKFTVTLQGLKDSITYTASASFTVAANREGAQGKDGTDGKNGTGCRMYEWYMLGSSSTAPTKKPSRSTDGTVTAANGWTAGESATQAQLTPTEELPYLWNTEETVTVSGDGAYTSVFSTPHLDTWYTKDGRGIKAISSTYCAGGDGETAPESGYDTYGNAAAFWSADKPYLWNRTVTVFDDGTTSERHHVCAIYGQTGLSGFTADDPVPHYLASAAQSGVTAETEGWTEEPQTVTAEKKYLWYYETRTYRSMSGKGMNLLPSTRTMGGAAVTGGDYHNTEKTVTDDNGNTFSVLYAYAQTDFSYVISLYEDRDFSLTLKGTVDALPPILKDEDGNVLNPAAGDTYRMGTSLHVFNGTEWEENTQSYVDCLTYNDIITPEEDEDYTLSFLAKGQCELWAYFCPECSVQVTASDGTSGTFSTVGNGGCRIAISSSEYRRYWIRWKTGSSISGKKSVIVCRLFRSSSFQTAYIYGVKLRRGDSVDEWSPAPEDLTSSTSPVIIGVYGDKGDRGVRGAVLRGPVEWSEAEDGFQFLCGADGETYIDYVKYNDTFYVCGKSHEKTSSNDPATSVAAADGLWKLGNEFALVLATIIVAAYAKINSLGVKNLDITDDEGNVLIHADKDGLECNYGTFKNIAVDSGTFTDMKAKSGTVGGITIQDNQLGTLSVEGSSVNGTGMLLNTENLLFKESKSRFLMMGLLKFLSTPYFIHMCDNEEKGSLDNKYGVEIMIRGAEDCCAVNLDGGYVSGLALSTIAVSSSRTIGRGVTQVFCNNTEAITLTLPVMYPYDNGHVIYIQNVNGKAVTIANAVCYYYSDVNTLRINYPVLRPWNDRIIVGNGTYSMNTAKNTGLRLVFTSQLSYTSDGTTYHGAWIASGMPRYTD